LVKAEWIDREVALVTLAHMARGKFSKEECIAKRGRDARILLAGNSCDGEDSVSV
jgi:hypothetical protein